MNGNKLKKLRENQGLLQKELADKIGISLSSISMYERGERQPDNDILKRLSQYFGVSTDYLLDNEVPHNELIDNELKEQEILRKALVKAGYMKKNEDITDEELDRLMRYLVANKEFLKGDK